MWWAQDYYTTDHHQSVPLSRTFRNQVARRLPHCFRLTRTTSATLLQSRCQLLCLDTSTLRHLPRVGSGQIPAIHTHDDPFPVLSSLTSPVEPIALQYWMTWRPPSPWISRWSFLVCRLWCGSGMISKTGLFVDNWLKRQRLAWRHDSSSSSSSSCCSSSIGGVKGGAQSSRCNQRPSSMGGIYAVVEFWLVSLATSSVSQFVYRMLFTWRNSQLAKIKIIRSVRCITVLPK